MDRDKSVRAPFGDPMLMGLIAGLSLGVLNVIVYLFFVFPIVAHDLFHTYMHYDAAVLGYAAAYVGILGFLGIPTALLSARALTEKSRHLTDVCDGVPQQRQTPK